MQRRILDGGSVLLSGFVLLLLWSGCAEKKHRRPPNERNRMVLEFFDAMDKGRSEDAVRQAERLQAIVPDSDFLRTAIDIQKSNVVIRKINALLQEGKLQEASKLLDAAMLDAPFNEQLKRCAAEMVKLEALDRALHGMDPSLYSEEQRLRLVQLKNALAPLPAGKEWTAVMTAAERNLRRQSRMETLEWHLLCDALLKELNAAETPDAELRSTVRILRRMGSAL